MAGAAAPADPGVTPLEPPPPRPRRSRRWSPERSRAIRRYRFAVLAMAILVAWGGALVYTLLERRSQLTAELTDARDEVRMALRILTELGIERPDGAFMYRAGAPILLKRKLLQDATFHPTPGVDDIAARVTLFNANANRRAIDLEVTLYDRLGLEIGRGRPSADYLSPLRPGELRTIHLHVPADRQRRPVWFTIDTDA